MTPVKPEISVIIATYNVERYVLRAIHSVLDQEGVNVEVVVVDDASNDGTWEQVQSISDPRLKSIRLGVNGGPGAARNTAMAEASGDWIAILDGDDAYAPGRLARCLKRAVENEADIVVDNIRVFCEASGAEFPMFEESAFSRMHNLSLARFIAGNRSFFSVAYPLGYLKPVFSAAFLRERNLKYDPGIRIGEDYMLLAEALASSAYCIVEHSIGYVYTVRKNSVSHRLQLDDIKHIASSDARFFRRYQLDPKAARAQRRRTASIQEMYHFTLLVDALKQKNAKDSLEVALCYPLVLRHMWRPVWKRVERLLPFHLQVSTQTGTLSR